MKQAQILENSDVKKIVSEDYNFHFDKKTGFFARWGKTQDEDPDFSPYGPEIADIEISTICSGVEGIGPCTFCYKANTKNGTYMPFETFQKLFHNLPKTLTQIAFGIGDIEANPDMWKIFDYCRDNGIIPNVTVNGEGITDEIADKLVSKCGAIAVSVYDKNKSYDTVKKLTDRGMKQVNIHFMISEETYETALEILKDKTTDERLKLLNAVVLLSLKPKGRAKEKFHPLSQEKFNTLSQYALSNNIGVGMDSCSAVKFLDSIRGTDDFDKYNQYVEQCESTRMSSYFNVEGKFFPCSFIENQETSTGDWREGLDAVNTDNFLNDIWYNKKTIDFRHACIECNHNLVSCPHYKI